MINSTGLCDSYPGTNGGLIQGKLFKLPEVAKDCPKVRVEVCCESYEIGDQEVKVGRSPLYSMYENNLWWLVSEQPSGSNIKLSTHTTCTYFSQCMYFSDYNDQLWHKLVDQGLSQWTWPCYNRILDPAKFMK